MYSLTIGVPFRRLDQQRCEVASDWAKSLFLLRDSFGGRFGPITVAAPALPAGDGLIGQQTPVILDSRRDDISFVELGQKEWRTRQFWRNYLSIRAAIDRLARASQVIHCGINDLWKPYAIMGFNAAQRANVTSVFVLDGDAVQRIADLNVSAGTIRRCRDAIYSRQYIRVAKNAVAKADLSLLKGSALHARYGQYARNAKDFFDTSFDAADVIDATRLEAKCRSVAAGDAIRCLSLGRLVDYKGVDHTINAIAQSAKRGANVQLDIIGEGPAEADLKRLVESLGIGDRVKFLGKRAYGPDLLKEIASYHLMLFTTMFEETPRSLFDAIAGGLGLLAFEITFTRQVVDQCGQGAVVAKGDVAGLAEKILDLDRDRTKLIEWMSTAARIAPQHAAQVWYQQRAQWTIEAYQRHNSQRLTTSVKRRALLGMHKMLYWSGTAAIYARSAAVHGATILLYHSVPDATSSQWIDPSNTMAADTFEAQMRFLSRRRRVISMSELVDAIVAGKPLEPGTVVITFDDGYRDNLEVVAPILAKYRLPATLYLATSALNDGHSWIDELYTMFQRRTRYDDSLDYRSTVHELTLADAEMRLQRLTEIEQQLRPSAAPPRLMLNWNEVRDLRKNFPDFELGVHTADHLDLAAHESSARAQIERSMDDFQRELGMAARHFSFPYGRFSPASQNVVRELGLRSAVIAGGNPLIDSQADVFALPRLVAPASMALLGFWTSGAYPGLSKAIFGRA